MPRYAHIKIMIALKPQNFWFNTLVLADGEEIILSYPANHTQGKRAVGGKLFVTQHRLAFAPNRFDAIFGGCALEIPVSTLTTIATDRPRLEVRDVFSGGLRTRLAIQHHEGVMDYFVVSNPEQAALEIRTALNGMIHRN